MADLQDFTIDTGRLQEKWDGRYRDSAGVSAPSRVVSDNAHLLPTEGRALDLACGLGANAMFLAAHGLAVEAWDLSPVAVEKLAESAARQNLKLQMRVRDVIGQPPEPASFDVIVVSHFLDRGLMPSLIAALRPNGLLFYQTFVRESVTGKGPSNPDFRLGRNELLTLLPGLVIRVYREEGSVGDCTRGFRDLAMLVGQRPS